MTISEQMASSFLFTTCEALKKRIQFNLQETPHFRKREQTGGVYTLEPLVQAKSERRETELPIGSPIMEGPSHTEFIHTVMYSNINKLLSTEQLHGSWPA